MTAMAGDAPPLVFVGPSCPKDDIRQSLPDALILPPVKRGDLYRYRILKFSHFILLDGVFTNSPAVSPREVVDVIRDGAVVVGAASMGALRAADCAPAGAIGRGRVFRFFQRQILSSEDEVAVSFRPDQPFPPLSEPLVNMRIALRRAVMRRLIPHKDASAIIAAASALPYARRTWEASFAGAGITAGTGQLDFLKACDAKRADAIGCCKWVAAQLLGSRLPASPSQSGRHLFGLMSEGRERSPAPGDGNHMDALMPEFSIWLAISGLGQRLGPAEFNTARKMVETAIPADIQRAVSQINVASASAEFDALLVGFIAFRKARKQAILLDLDPDEQELSLAEAEIVKNHRQTNWQALLQNLADRPVLRRKVCEYKTDLARVKCLKNRLFGHKGGNTPLSVPIIWDRT